MPDEDPGSFIVTVQGPSGASLGYTAAITDQAYRILSQQKDEVSAVFIVNGFSFLGSGSNKAMMFVRLRPFDERPGEEHSAMAVIQRLYRPFGAITGAVVLPYPAAADPGDWPVRRLPVRGARPERRGHREAGDGHAARSSDKATARRGLTGLFSGFTTNDPQLVVTVDREALQALGLRFGDVADDAADADGRRTT